MKTDPPPSESHRKYNSLLSYLLNADVTWLFSGSVSVNTSFMNLDVEFLLTYVYVKTFLAILLSLVPLAMLAVELLWEEEIPDPRNEL